MSESNELPRNAERKLIRNSTAEFLIFTAQEGSASIEARYEDETIWLSQKLIAELFAVDVRTVSEHLRNVFSSGELDETATIRKFRIVQMEGSREVSRSIDHYNLDAIISVGYRVNSLRATQFRQWATQVLRDFSIRGYVLDRECLERRNGWTTVCGPVHPYDYVGRTQGRWDERLVCDVSGDNGLRTGPPLRLLGSNARQMG